MDRREFIVRGSQSGLLAATFPLLNAGGAEINHYSPLPPGPDVDRFKQAQRKLLSVYGVSAKSRFVTLKSSLLSAHVLAAGEGPSVLLIHGGGLFGASWVQLLAPLQTQFHAFAPDMPGCGLTYRVDYRGLPFRTAAERFVTEIMDTLHLKEAAVVGHSLGGYFALVLALAHPERVTKLVLLGEPAGSQPRSQWQRIASNPSFRAKFHVTMEDTRHTWSQFIVAHLDRVSRELLNADNAGSNLSGYATSWNSMIDEVLAEKDFGFSYEPRPELGSLRPSTLLVWGDKDFFGPPSEGLEMAGLAPRARCEVLQDTGHAVWIDQPERCAELVISFLLSKT
jgi:pimeloyl-ACP methyl ester carboxylesterase